MDYVKDLWIHKKEEEGRINITLFFINIFLIMCHIILMFFYSYACNDFMISINIFSLIMYCGSISVCYKNHDAYISLTYCEILFHMVCAILSFGWSPCFQNWSFALISAFFLPVFNDTDEKNHQRQAYIFTTLVILIYFLLPMIINIIDFKYYQELPLEIAKLLFIGNNVFSFFSIIMFSIFYTSSRRRKEIELARKASYDKLTNLYNRHALTQAADDLIRDAIKNKKTYSVAIVDIDFFKKVNDKYGHINGDNILIQLADILKTFTTKEIIVGRWGGEEFVIICPRNIYYSEFMKILERLRVKVSKHPFILDDGREINITISIGASRIRRLTSLEKAVDSADVNLYEAKKNGRNRVIG